MYLLPHTADGPSVRRMQTRMAVLLVLPFAACSKSDSKSDPKSGPAPAEKPAAAAAAIPAGELADFDLPGAAKKFDGKTFVIKSSLGKQVWSFANGKVTIVDAQTEKAGDLELRSPCGLAVRAKKADGLEDVIEKSFAWNGDTLYLGGGYGGAKRGDTYVACYGLDAYMSKAGSCKLGSTTGAANWAPAKCTVDASKFATEQVTYEIVGDALVDSTLKGNIAELVPSLAEGKAKLAAQ